jgi:transcriptional regulator with XRE-family HTH domain
MLAREEEIARIDRGLSLRDVGDAVGVSPPTMGRFATGKATDVGIVRASQILGVVGLDLSVRAYPGGQPMRDAGHAALLGRFRACLHRDLGWAVEVPLPHPGDLRAWDALIRGRAWLYGIEAETHPTDGQALIRRLELKQRDGEVVGVILVLQASRHTQLFLAAAGDLLAAAFPVPGRRALALLTAGVNPGGNAVVVL